MNKGKNKKELQRRLINHFFVCFTTLKNSFLSVFYLFIFFYFFFFTMLSIKSIKTFTILFKKKLNFFYNH